MFYFIVVMFPQENKQKHTEMKVVPMLFYNVGGQAKQARMHHANRKGKLTVRRVMKYANPK